MLINGGLAVDDRGTVTFVNDFNFEGVKRFYMVQNHANGFVRAWHGHKKEAKYVLVVRGSIKLGVVDMNTEELQAFVLSAQKPQVLYIPSGNYNGFKTLTDDAQVIFFSTVTMDEAKDDDFRFEARKWDIWDIEER